MRCTFFAIVILSVCLSVCLSHSWTVSTWFNLRSWFHHMVAPYHYRFWGYQVHHKIRRGSPRTRALNEGGVCTNWSFSTNKPPYLRNGARYDKGYYWSLIGNYIRAFDWYQNQRPWLTLKWPWTAIMHSVAFHTCVSEPTTKICMKTDSYYQRQKCSPEILVSSKVSFMQIFEGVRWRGVVEWEWGGRKWRFSLLSLAISSESSHLRPRLLYCAM